MRKLLFLLVIPFLMGASLKEPPPDDNLSVQTQEYLKELYKNIGSSDYYVGSFTRDTTLASGTQSITGVGFKPKVLIFLLNELSTAEMSIGIDDGTTACHIRASPTAGQFIGDKTSSLSDVVSGANYEGKISSLDDDGFTVTWTKTGSPSGTINVYYLAFK